MIASLTQLLVFQLLGEVLVRALTLSVPGPVMGMLLLFGFLLLRSGPDRELLTTSQTLLQHLSLLFVPAGTGVMLHLQLVAREWLPLLLSVIVSTLLSLVVTALLMHFLQSSKTEPGETA